MINAVFKYELDTALRPSSQDVLSEFLRIRTVQWETISRDNSDLCVLKRNKCTDMGKFVAKTYWVRVAYLAREFWDERKDEGDLFF